MQAFRAILRFFFRALGILTFVSVIIILGIRFFTGAEKTEELALTLITTPEAIIEESIDPLEKEQIEKEIKILQEEKNKLILRNTPELYRIINTNIKVRVEDPRTSQEKVVEKLTQWGTQSLSSGCYDAGDRPSNISCNAGGNFPQERMDELRAFLEGVGEIENELNNTYENYDIVLSTVNQLESLYSMRLRLIRLLSQATKIEQKLEITGLIQENESDIQEKIVSRTHQLRERSMPRVDVQLVQ